MIRLTRLNGEELHVSAWQIETVAPKPDTQLTLSSGRQIYVKESPADIHVALLCWFRAIHALPEDA